MKAYKATGEELFSGSLALGQDDLYRANVRVLDAMDLDLPPLSIEAEPDKEGLRLCVNIPRAGIDPIYLVIEPDDMKALKKMPGKGFLSFVLKSLR